MRLRAICLAASATLLIAASATAETGSFYVGLEGGPTLGRDNDVDEVVDLAAATAGTEYDDALSVGYEPGHDIGVAGGFDFGLLRVELEVAHKQASLKPVKPDENFESFIGSVPASTGGDLDLPGKISIVSAMINGLIDVGVTDRLSLYGGGGYGRSWAQAVGDEDGAWGWQWIAGVRYAISEKVEIGLKQRYFNSGIIKLHGPLSHAGYAVITPEIEGEYRTRSLLVSFNFNF